MLGNGTRPFAFVETSTSSEEILSAVAELGPSLYVSLKEGPGTLSLTAKYKSEAILSWLMMSQRLFHCN